MAPKKKKKSFQKTKPPKTGRQLKKQLGELGLAHHEFARMCRRSYAGVCLWLNDTSEIPGYALSILAQHREIIRLTKLLAENGIESDEASAK